MLVITIAATACQVGSTTDESEMYQLASRLTKLSAVVESTCFYKNPPSNTVDQALLGIATAHDTTLLEPFVDFKLRAECKQQHGFVLVCSKDGDRGLLEDAGCSGKLDGHLWKDHKKRCEFTLSVQAICDVP
jgi:hypothetical protein